MLLWTSSKSSLCWAGLSVCTQALFSSSAHGFGLARCTVRSVPAIPGLSVGTTEYEVTKIDWRLQIKLPTAWAIWAAWIIYQARISLHFVWVLWRQRRPPQDQGAWLEECWNSLPNTQSLPLLSVQGWKKGGKKVAIPAPLGKLALEVKSYLREAGICPNLGHVNHSAASAYL